MGFSLCLWGSRVGFCNGWPGDRRIEDHPTPVLDQHHEDSNLI